MFYMPLLPSYINLFMNGTYVDVSLLKKLHLPKLKFKA